MADKTENPELDASGRLANPVYLNHDNPTTKFTTAELPANATARALFPKNLIDENNVTESPASDAGLEGRIAAARRALKAEAEKLEGELERLGVSVKNAEAAAKDVTPPVETAPAEAPKDGDATVQA